MCVVLGSHRVPVLLRCMGKIKSLHVVDNLWNFFKMWQVLNHEFVGGNLSYFTYMLHFP